MSLEDLKKKGVRFSYCRYAVVPEIPKVQDVLYALRISETDEYFGFCQTNHEVYVANVLLVAAAVCVEVLALCSRDEREGRKLIAKAIMELCPDEARCLFVGAYAQAKQTAEGDVSVVTDRDQLRRDCRCLRCRERIHEMSTFYEAEVD